MARASLRTLFYHQLDPLGRRAHGLAPGNMLVAGLILGSCVVAVLETEPRLYLDHGAIFAGLEWVFATLFLIEYGMRLWIAPESGRYGEGWRAVLRYAATPVALLDLLAILPVFLLFVGTGTPLLRLVRLLRLLRLARLGPFSHALHDMLDALMLRSYELGLSLVMGFLLLLVSSTLLYLCEADVQPQDFGSIPRAMWWSVATLTTVGYGDAIPVTVLGRIFAGFTAVAGIVLIALPAGILAAAFSDVQQRRRANPDRRR